MLLLSLCAVALTSVTILVTSDEVGCEEGDATSFTDFVSCREY